MTGINGSMSSGVTGTGSATTTQPVTGLDSDAQKKAVAKEEAKKIKNAGKAVETTGKVTNSLLSAAGFSAAGEMIEEASGYVGDAANIGAGAHETIATGDSTALIGAVSSTATSTLSSSLDKQPSAFSAEGKAAAHTRDAEKLSDRANKADERSKEAAADANTLRESENFNPGKKHERLTETAIDQKERKDRLAERAFDHSSAAENPEAHRYSEQSEQFLKKADRFTEKANDVDDADKQARLREKSGSFTSSAFAIDQKARES